MAKTSAANLKDLKTEINILHQIIGILGTSNNLNTLLEETARVLASNLRSDSCFIYLLDQNARELTLSGAWPPHPGQIGKLRLGTGEGLTGWVADHRKPVSISKNASSDSRFKFFSNLPEDKFEAFLSVPIILSNTTTGVINLQNRRARTFPATRVKLLTSIASQIANAIEKTRFVQLANRKARQLETIARLSSSIVSNAYLQEILQLIVTMTAQMMDSKICSLMLLDDQTQELRIAATQSLSETYRKKPALKVGQSVSGLAVKNRKPVAVIDVTKESSYVYPGIAREEGLVSMLAVPMLIKDKPIGVINCYTTTEHIYSSEEISILKTIANQSAIAIETTRLLEESKSSREALETRKLVERAKGLLMKERHISEEEAFQFIQRQAMNLRRTMREIAEAVILTEGIKKTGPSSQ
jgi:signal transduction protein with GAF and PtsI domain